MPHKVPQSPSPPRTTTPPAAAPETLLGYRSTPQPGWLLRFLLCLEACRSVGTAYHHPGIGGNGFVWLCRIVVRAAKAGRGKRCAPAPRRKDTKALLCKTKRPPGLHRTAFRFNPGGDLRSHTVARAVSSAQRGLTSVFGMGTGVTLAV
jgi:hypothetical protein